MRGLRSSRVKAVKKDTLIVTVDVGMKQHGVLHHCGREEVCDNSVS